MVIYFIAGVLAICGVLMVLYCLGFIGQSFLEDFDRFGCTIIYSSCWQQFAITVLCGVITLFAVCVMALGLCVIFVALMFAGKFVLHFI